MVLYLVFFFRYRSGKNLRSSIFPFLTQRHLSFQLRGEEEARKMERNYEVLQFVKMFSEFCKITRDVDQ